MRPQKAEPPEDWSGSIDIDYEDLPYIPPLLHQDWQSELDRQEPAEQPEEFD
jgi:hypothetical protein